MSCFKDAFRDKCGLWIRTREHAGEGTWEIHAGNPDGSHPDGTMLLFQSTTPHASANEARQEAVFLLSIASEAIFTTYYNESRESFDRDLAKCFRAGRISVGKVFAPLHRYSDGEVVELNVHLIASMCDGFAHDDACGHGTSVEMNRGEMVHVRESRDEIRALIESTLEGQSKGAGA